MFSISAQTLSHIGQVLYLSMNTKPQKAGVHLRMDSKPYRAGAIHYKLYLFRLAILGTHQAQNTCPTADI